MRLVLLFAAALFLAPAALAADQLAFKGKVLSGELNRRGAVTISSKAVTFDYKGLFASNSIAWTFKELEKVEVSKGLFHTRIKLTSGKEEVIYIRTLPRYYFDAKELLKSKL